MKAAFHTLGCKVNSYETEAVLEQFAGAAFEIADFNEFADVYVINTCSVTKEAARKSRQIINRPKKINPKACVIAIGCYAQEAKDELLKDSGADIVIGNNEKAKTLEILNRYLENNRKGILVDDLTHCLDYERQQISNRGEHVRAYVKIQDGCNRFCSYCIIPYLRGRSRSRSEEDIINEVKTLAANGHKEIVLTGIDISMYGLDNRTDLIQLVSRINDINAVERIRFGSLEVSLITENFVQHLSALKKVCPHFHLSLQSGCDTVLKRMNRKYTSDEYEKAVGILRTYYKNPAITTDIIAGFPGETEDEFEKTLDFVRKIGFAQIHVFPYSRRKGTKADKMDGQLTHKKKSERVAKLISAGKELRKKYLKNYYGKNVPVLIEEEVVYNGKKYQTGYSPEYVKFYLETEENMINEIVNINAGPESFSLYGI